MSALGSSVISKSSKKFAPKPQARRHATGAPTASAPAQQVSKQNIADAQTPPPTASSSHLPPVLAPLPYLPNESFPDDAQEIETPASPPTPGQSNSIKPSQSTHGALNQAAPQPISSEKDLPSQHAHIVRNASTIATQAVQDGLSPSQEQEINPVAKRRRVDVQRPESPASSQNVRCDPNVAIPTTETDDRVLRATTPRLSTQSSRSSGKSRVYTGDQEPPSSATTNSDAKKRQRRSKAAAQSAQPGAVVDNNLRDVNGQNASIPKTGEKKRSGRSKEERSKRQRIEQAAAEVVIDAAQGGSKDPKTRAKRSKKAATPEHAAHHRIDTNEVRMTDLTVDAGTGQKSHREAELRELDRVAFVKKKQQQLQKLVDQSDTPPRADNETLRRDHSELHREREEEVALNVPNVVIINGQIRIDESSLRIDRHAAADRERENQPQLEGVEESELSRRINSATYMRRDKSGGWNELLLERFYDGLRMFGTDFGMISKMFPGKTRHSVKLRFTKEEKANPGRIKSTLLGEHMPVDLDDYQKLTGEEYRDPALLDKEMEDDKRQLEEEVEAEKAAIEAARIERIEQAEVARVEAGNDSSSKENRRKRRKKEKGERKGKRKEDESAPKRPSRRRAGGMLEGDGEVISDKARRAREINMV